LNQQFRTKKKAKETPKLRKLWDRPRPHQRGEEYRPPDTTEVSRPEEFIARIRDISRRRIAESGLKLPTIDESQEVIERQKARYEKPRTSNEVPAPFRSHPRRRIGNSESDMTNLRQGWHERYQDILEGVPEELPPLRTVNHEINLIDPDKKYTYHLPRCPASVRKEFQHKLNRYVNAQWWVPATGTQAAPLMCVPKKDGRLRTVVDARQRNDNTRKDVTPLPDQDVIREDVARAKYRSKIDLADAYEQVRVEPRDVPKTLFSTVMGTYHSNVVQQGDCNAPATFQRLMTSIFRDVIGKFMHVYLDDIFVFSESVEDHESQLKVVFD